MKHINNHVTLPKDTPNLRWVQVSRRCERRRRVSAIVVEILRRKEQERGSE